MAKNNKSVFGIYKTRQGIERAVLALKEANFRPEDISVLAPSVDGIEELAVRVETKAPEGLATGAGTGAVIGGVLGWLIGAGILAIPGFGPFIAAGPIMAALAGLGVGGTVGGFSGALVGLGVPEFEAKRYQGYIEEGGILLSVHVDNSKWERKAKDILEYTSASDITSSSEIGSSMSYYSSNHKEPLNSDIHNSNHSFF